MKKIFYPAEKRGAANLGWLKAKYSFSFANYNDPQKIHFGMLRVLNDDLIEPGKGFGEHHHDNMEIVTIPLKGALAHKDNTGHEEVILPNEVQIMSAGTGIMHSEYNYSKKDDLNLFQIWIFPREKNISPRYDQKTFSEEERINKWQLLVSPNKNDKSLWINQDAYFNRATILPDSEIGYTLHSNENGVFLIIIDGKIKVDGDTLTKRDALGISETNKFNIISRGKSDVLLIEIPMR